MARPNGDPNSKHIRLGWYIYEYVLENAFPIPYTEIMEDLEISTKRDLRVLVDRYYSGAFKNDRNFLTGFDTGYSLKAIEESKEILEGKIGGERRR